MSIEALTSMPPKFAAGETWKVQRSYSDAPASAGWVVTFYFVNATVSPFNQACTAVGDDHLLTMAAATTATKTAGVWYYEARAVLGSETVKVENGELEITPNFSNIAGASDQRGHARKMLDAINAALEGRATETLLEYSINTGKTMRQLKHMDHMQLMAARERYVYLAKLEETGGRGPNRNIYARFK